MPFKSEAQRKYLWANEPEIARDWTDTYGSKIQAAQGGRIGFEKGGFDPGKRNFLKILGGLAALPVVGKFFKWAKPAAKV